MTAPRPSLFRRLIPFAVPYPHFMGFAPLDAWLRLLLFPPAWIPVRFWLRLALGLFTSALGTAFTLPERLVLAPVLFLVGRRRRHMLAHEPGVVVVLGYFRTGTTHLHNLLSCDRRFQTPKWYQALAPQGFAASWTFLRLFLVPFLANNRPQDDVPFGPEWPAEEDFALCNWAAASSLVGRGILPAARSYEHYRHFHSLDGLSPRGRRLWRRTQWAFLWKLSLFMRRRRMLLKTPSHTARIAELMDLFTAPRVKFVHISRSPVAVVRSNVALHQRMQQMYALQPSPTEDQTQRRIVEEYLDTERRYLEQIAVAPAGHATRIRYEDLVADPVGELRRIYRELDLGWSEPLEAEVRRYLARVGEYTAATPASKGIERPTGALEPLAPLIELFGHDRPPVPAGPAVSAAGAGARQSQERRRRLAWAVAPIMAVLSAGAWLGLAVLLHNRLDWMIWPTGIAIGWGTIQAAKVGSMRLGLGAAALTLAVFVALGFATTYFIYQGATPWAWWEIRKTTLNEMRSGATIPWVVVGVLSALRFASRTHVHPPGR